MRLILSGGGTGGHIYPALAIAKAVLEKEPKSEILYIGSNRGIERKLVSDFGLTFVGLDLQGLSRSNPFANVKTLQMLNKSIRASNKLIQSFKPDIVIGTGGYASSAVLLSAQRKKVPTLIHEQNLIPGVTNKYLARKASAIAESIPESRKHFPIKTRDKVVLTGNPRGQWVVDTKSKFKLSSLGLDDKKKTLLIFGGSGGALAINQAVVGAAHRFAKEKNFQTIFVTGNKYFKSVEAQLAESNIKPNKNFAVLPYIDNMDQVIKKIDLIVARSGATTLAEITALGMPSILIPSPNVTGNQQEINAKLLEEKKAAMVIEEEEMSPAKLYHDAKKILEDNKLRKELSKNALENGFPDASDRVYKLMKKVINESKSTNKR